MAERGPKRNSPPVRARARHEWREDEAAPREVARHQPGERGLAAVSSAEVGSSAARAAADGDRRAIDSRAAAGGEVGPGRWAMGQGRRRECRIHRRFGAAEKRVQKARFSRTERPALSASMCPR